MDGSNNYCVSLAAVQYSKAYFRLSSSINSYLSGGCDGQDKGRDSGAAEVQETSLWKKTITFKYRCSNVMKLSISTCCCVAHKPEIETCQAGSLEHFLQIDCFYSAPST